jgi:hypothetical protein
MELVHQQNLCSFFNTLFKAKKQTHTQTNRDKEREEEGVGGRKEQAETACCKETEQSTSVA